MYVQWQGLPTVEMRRALKQLQILPSVKNEQLLFVTLDFRPFKRCNGWRKLLIYRTDLVAARDVFLKAIQRIRQSISSMKIIINSVLLSQKILPLNKLIYLPPGDAPHVGNHSLKKTQDVYSTRMRQLFTLHLRLAWQSTEHLLNLTGSRRHQFKTLFLIIVSIT
jgi:hypothetical protein